MPERNESSSVRAGELQRVRPVAAQSVSRSHAPAGTWSRKSRALESEAFAEIEESLTHQGPSLTTDSMVRYPRPVNRNVRNHNTWQQPVTGGG